MHHSPDLVQQANAAALPFVFSACPVPCSRRRAVARVAMDLESQRAGAPADAGALAPLGERTTPHTSFQRMNATGSARKRAARGLDDHSDQDSGSEADAEDEEDEAEEDEDEDASDLDEMYYDADEFDDEETALIAALVPQVSAASLDYVPRVQQQNAEPLLQQQDPDLAATDDDQDVSSDSSSDDDDAEATGRVATSTLDAAAPVELGIHNRCVAISVAEDGTKYRCDCEADADIAGTVNKCLGHIQVCERTLDDLARELGGYELAHKAAELCNRHKMSGRNQHTSRAGGNEGKIAVLERRRCVICWHRWYIANAALLYRQPCLSVVARLFECSRTFAINPWCGITAWFPSGACPASSTACFRRSSRTRSCLSRAPARVWSLYVAKAARR